MSACGLSRTSGSAPQAVRCPQPFSAISSLLPSPKNNHSAHKNFSPSSSPFNWCWPCGQKVDQRWRRTTLSLAVSLTGNVSVEQQRFRPRPLVRTPPRVVPGATCTQAGAGKSGQVTVLNMSGLFLLYASATRIAEYGGVRELEKHGSRNKKHVLQYYYIIRL